MVCLNLTTTAPPLFCAPHKKKGTTITQVTTLQLARDTSIVSSISYRKRSKRDLDDGFERVLIKQNFYEEERHRELGDSFQLLMF